MLNVLVVDDVETNRKMLVHIVNSADDLKVIGEATNGREAVAATRRLRPDVILMDVNMPDMDGLEATRNIMVETPTPIVIVSGSIAGRETEVAFQAIKQGALTVLNKPVGFGDPEFDAQVRKLLSTVRAMATVRVIHHRQPAARPTQETQPKPPVVKATSGQKPEVIVIGSSTGGPAALAEILQRLPADFPLPVLIVQHIASDFIPSLTQWLDSVTPLHVQVAGPHDIPHPGRVYIAPGSLHLRVNVQQRFVLNAHPQTPHIPSVDVMFESIAKSYGARAIGVLLTGMGADGAHGLKLMRDAGAITIAQDEASCVVFGMPKEAIAQGAVQHVQPLTAIPKLILSLTHYEANMKQG